MHGIKFWLVNTIIGSALVSANKRTWLLRKLGFKNIEENVTFEKNVTLESKKIKISGPSFINQKAMFYGSLIELQKGVGISFNVLVTSYTHELGTSQNRTGKSIEKKVTIEEGVWIGANSTILPGVTIGKGAMVAAGAVVSKDIPANELWGGVPARKIKNLGDGSDD